MFIAAESQLKEEGKYSLFKSLRSLQKPGKVLGSKKFPNSPSCISLGLLCRKVLHRHPVHILKVTFLGQAQKRGRFLYSGGTPMYPEKYDLPTTAPKSKGESTKTDLALCMCCPPLLVDRLKGFKWLAACLHPASQVVGRTKTSSLTLHPPPQLLWSYSSKGALKSLVHSAFDGLSGGELALCKSMELQLHSSVARRLNVGEKKVPYLSAYFFQANCLIGLRMVGLELWRLQSIGTFADLWSNICLYVDQVSKSDSTSNVIRSF